MRYHIGYTPDKDIYRYYYTANKIAQGLYGSRFYYVLPKMEGLSARERCSSVHFPNLNLITSDEWETLKHIEVSSTPEIIKSFESYEKVEKKVTKDYAISSKRISDIEIQWNNIKDNFTKLFDEQIKDYHKFKNIFINLTSIGSLSSYTILNDDNLDLYFRIDVDISHIAEVQIAASIYNQFNSSSKYATQHYGQEVNWFVTESVVDFFMLHTKFKDIFPNFIPTIEGTDFDKFPLISKKSIDYLRILGFSPVASLRVEKDDIVRSSGEILRGLNNQEFQILKLLIEKNNHLCSYEDMAKTIWKDEYLEKFSMYALNKLIFQIRHKLRLNKLHNVSIKTKRNAGYVLYF